MNDTSQKFIDTVALKLLKFKNFYINDILDDGYSICNFLQLIDNLFSDHQSGRSMYTWSVNDDDDNVDFKIHGSEKRTGKYSTVYIESKNVPILVDFYKINSKFYNTFMMHGFESLDHPQGLKSMLDNVCSIAWEDTNVGKMYVNSSSKTKFWKFLFYNIVDDERKYIDMSEAFEMFTSGLHFNCDIVSEIAPGHGECAFGFGIGKIAKVIKNETHETINPVIVLSNFIIIPDNMIKKMGFIKLMLK